MCQKNGEPAGDEKTGKKCDDWHKRRMEQRQTDAKKLNVPLMITEFGACYDTPACVREIEQVMDHCENTQCAGWAYWQFKQYKDHTTVGDKGMQGFYNQFGQLQQGKIYALSRPYMMKIPGLLTFSKYDPDNKQYTAIFKLSMRYNQACEAVIFVNEQYYFPNGFVTVIKKHKGGPTPITSEDYIFEKVVKDP